MTLCLIDTNIFLCLAFEDPGHQHCGELLDHAFKGDFNPLLSSIQITELLTPFYRAQDLVGLQKMKIEITNLKPKNKKCRSTNRRKSRSISLHHPNAKRKLARSSRLYNTRHRSLRKSSNPLHHRHQFRQRQTNQNKSAWNGDRQLDKTVRNPKNKKFRSQNTLNIPMLNAKSLFGSY